MDDRNLIEAYFRDGSESAFAELIRRYEGLVFSAAMRHVRDADLARDVVQNVFLCVARKAAALACEPVLAGWLGRTARFEALKLLRDRRRRNARQQVFVSGTTTTAMATVESTPPGQVDDGAYLEVAAALRGLETEERRALVLRYHEGKSLKEIARMLEISEDAAQKRVSRALQRLRAAVNRRGLSCSTAETAALLGGAALAGSSVSGIGAAVSAAPAISGTSTSITATAVVTPAGASLFATLVPLLAMTKLKLVAITCAVTAATMVPLAVHYLRIDERPPSASAPTLPIAERSAAALKNEPARVDDVPTRSARPVVEKLPAGTTAEPDPITALRQRALQPQNNPLDRLAALRELRDRNARDPEVVAAMVALARTSTDPAIRADIFRQLHGTKDMALKWALIEALQRDASDEVRAEAAETLGDYANDPDAQALLLTVSRSDADPDTQAAAMEARFTDAPVEVLRRVQTDPAATDLELYHSASVLRKREGSNAAQATVLVKVLKASANSDLRKEIVEDLGKHYGAFPEVAEWIEHLATNEPDPKVRKEAGKFITP